VQLDHQSHKIRAIWNQTESSVKKPSFHTSSRNQFRYSLWKFM